MRIDTLFRIGLAVVKTYRKMNESEDHRMVRCRSCGQRHRIPGFVFDPTNFDDEYILDGLPCFACGYEMWLRVKN